MSVNPEILSTAFIMGIAGSLHCIGMCGPLALSIPVSHNGNMSRLKTGLVYNTGRIFSYSLMGLIFGAAGKLIIRPEWQNRFSIILGVVIIVYLFIPKRIFHFANNRWTNKPFLWLRQQMGLSLHSGKKSSICMIGVLNGFLPCGLVYLALSSSAISGDPLSGVLFMMSFGLGTFPAMLSAVVFGNYLNQKIRLKIYKAVPLLLFFMAMLLILRGMELGVPFISPSFARNAASSVSCH